MTHVKRYDPTEAYGEATMREYPDGDYVSFDDYAALEAEVVRLRELERQNEMYRELVVGEGTWQRFQVAEADTRRMEDLCELVQSGELGLCIVGGDGEEDEYMDGLADIRPLLDKWVTRAANWRKARLASEARKAAQD